MDKNDKILEQTGLRIRQLRTHAGISQESLAHSAGISPVYLGQIERGLKAPTIVIISKLCDALEIGLSEFFLFDEISGDDKYNLAYKTVASALRELPPDSAFKLSFIIQELSQLNKK